MELRQIRYFLAVADAGNIGAAARNLHISQPPLTRQIHKLEAEIGGPLFTRTAKGVTLTDTGNTFLAEARSILAQTELALERSRSTHLGKLGELNIGFLGSPIYTTIPRILRLLKTEAPDVSVTLHRMSKQEQIAALRDGRIHAGFARYYPEEPDLEIIEVETENIALAVSEDNQLQGSNIRISELADLELILYPNVDRPNFADIVLAILKNANFVPRVASTAEDLTSALALTAANLGCCLVPEGLTKIHWPGVRIIKIQGVPKTIPVHCVFLKDNASPVLAELQKSLDTFMSHSLGD